MNAAEYWNKRYAMGQTSGDGSYGKLAEFKARYINELIASHQIRSVIDFGCGDGNQQRMIRCDDYVGFDVSEKAVSRCRKKYPHRQFETIDNYAGEFAELAVSLDVIFHLTDSYLPYMRRLFNSAIRYVVIYSTNIEYPSHPSARHVRHRRFAKNVPASWRLVEYMPNPYPELSNSDFFVYSPTGTDAETPCRA